MTLSSSPTYIVTDGASTSFALTIKPNSASVYDPSKGPPSLPGFKKGHTVLIENPRRKGVKEGNLGFVEAKEGEVRVCLCTCFPIFYIGVERDNWGR